MAVGKKDKKAPKPAGGTKQHLKGENFYRDAKKVKKLNMYKNNGAQRNKEGKVTQAAAYQSRDIPTARIAPDRKWFGNTRVISQDTLKAFRDAMADKANDPHTFLLKRNKLPMSLIEDKEQKQPPVSGERARDKVHASDFGSAFGPKSQRNRVNFGASSFEDLSERTNMSEEGKEGDLPRLMGEDGKDAALESAFTKGQSHRIWSELHKVIDASDVLFMVLDARDPQGTRCEAIEKHIAKDAPHKHLVFILNKCDLVPTKVASAWVRKLCTIRPTLAFRASLKNPFGKGALISLIRQFSQLHKDRKTITAGVVGYPNTGKSSLLNTLRGKAVAKTAPIPGETKLWQYIHFTDKVLLLDSPGVVPRQVGIDPSVILLRGAIRVENINDPSEYISAVLERCEPKHISRTYEIEPQSDPVMFLEILGRKWGRLLKGGEVDVDAVARTVIRDFLMGRLPWFTPPPLPEGMVEDKDKTSEKIQSLDQSEDVGEEDEEDDDDDEEDDDEDDDEEMEE